MASKGQGSDPLEGLEEQWQKDLFTLLAMKHYTEFIASESFLEWRLRTAQTVPNSTSNNADAGMGASNAQSEETAMDWLLGEERE